MGRRIKSLKVKKGYSHREHRSKKGRKNIKGFTNKKRVMDYKLKKEKLKYHENSISHI